MRDSRTTRPGEHEFHLTIVSSALATSSAVVTIVSGRGAPRGTQQLRERERSRAAVDEQRLVGMHVCSRGACDGALEVARTRRVQRQV